MSGRKPDFFIFFWKPDFWWATSQWTHPTVKISSSGSCVPCTAAPEHSSSTVQRAQRPASLHIPAGPTLAATAHVSSSRPAWHILAAGEDLEPGSYCELCFYNIDKVKADSEMESRDWASIHAAPKVCDSEAAARGLLLPIWQSPNQLPCFKHY